MPELPEVEVLVRHLAPQLKGKTIRAVNVRRPKVIAPTSARKFSAALCGARFAGVTRRGKYLLFNLRRERQRPLFTLLGHLGMTGRMYLRPAGEPLPKHAAVVLTLGRMNFIYEDTRYFGRLTLETRGLESLGPEPLGNEFTAASFARVLQKSAQAIKVKLLDQSLVAGIGNIYASEALFRAGLSPRRAARGLNREEVRRLWRAIRVVLRQAIDCGSTLPLDWAGAAGRDGLFYYGRAVDAPDYYEERLLVYDRRGRPCSRCATPICRIVQAARSTFYCPKCQRL